MVKYQRNSLSLTKSIPLLTVVKLIPLFIREC